MNSSHGLMVHDHGCQEALKEALYKIPPCCEFEENLRNQAGYIVKHTTESGTILTCLIFPFSDITAHTMKYLMTAVPEAGSQQKTKNGFKEFQTLIPPVLYKHLNPSLDRYDLNIQPEIHFSIALGFTYQSAVYGSLTRHAIIVHTSSETTQALSSVPLTHKSALLLCFEFYEVTHKNISRPEDRKSNHIVHCSTSPSSGGSEPPTIMHPRLF